MAVNKVVYGGKTVIDLTSDTVTAAKMLSGATAHDKSGAVVTGSIATKTSSNLTASGATVTVPAGYYASQATKSVATGSAKTPATTVTKNPSISVNSSGLITASVSGTQSVTPTVSAGYVSSGTAGTITVSGSATKQLTVQAAQTITPGTSNKTIASGRYLTGTQTIKGDANLVASNIKSGVSIFGVTGTYAGTTENLDSVITELENKTATLNTTLANKAAGGGGGVEACEVVVCNGTGTSMTVWYVDASLELCSVEISNMSSQTISTIRGSSITFCDIHTMTGDEYYTAVFGEHNNEFVIFAYHVYIIEAHDIEYRYLYVSGQIKDSCTVEIGKY